MSEVFCDRAARWFLSSGLRDMPCSVFRMGFLEFFLPQRYFERLEDQIRSRRQRVGDEFKKYLIELRALMHHARYETARELHRIYENAAPEYKLYVRRQDFSTLAQLAVEYETVMREREWNTREAGQGIRWSRAQIARNGKGRNSPRGDT
ncbi:uncharacterized protein [Drosophila virilis]|uniref:uncharacterized protein isoform X8 n=1 Tax=Drosophila virilis TaxID=7244 RepID=UPI0038B38921